jgi:hypothetical protein
VSEATTEDGDEERASGRIYVVRFGGTAREQLQPSLRLSRTRHCPVQLQLVVDDLSSSLGLSGAGFAQRHDDSQKGSKEWGMWVPGN